VIILLVVLIFLLLILVLIYWAIVYWYITVPIIVGYVLLKNWYKKNQQKTTQDAGENSKNYDQNYSEYKQDQFNDSTDYDPNYSWHGQRQAYNTSNSYYSGYKKEYYSQKNKHNRRTSQSSTSREQRIQKRLAEFNITYAEAEMIFGKTWRSKLAMYDFRLFYLIKELEINIKYDPYGRYKRKYASVIGKVLAIIKIVTDANPDLQRDFEENVTDFGDVNDDTQDYQSEQNYNSHNSEQHTYESQQDDIDAAFQILELKNTTTHAEIKKKYKELILKYHPDRNVSPNANAKTKEIIAAYNLIMKLHQEAQ